MGTPLHYATPPPLQPAPPLPPLSPGVFWGIYAIVGVDSAFALEIFMQAWTGKASDGRYIVMGVLALAALATASLMVRSLRRLKLRPWLAVTAGLVAPLTGLWIAG